LSGGVLPLDGLAPRSSFRGPFSLARVLVVTGKKCLHLGLVDDDAVVLI